MPRPGVQQSTLVTGQPSEPIHHQGKHVMWLSLRRAICTLVLVAGLMCVSLLHLALAQPMGQLQVKQPGLQPAPPKDGGEVTDLDKNIALPRDNTLRRKMEAVQDYIKAKDWVKACQLLQFIVEGDQDVFVPVKRTGADGSETSVDVSIKKEANRLIANLPPEGQEFYKLTYGQLATDKLKEAKEQRSKKLLAEVIRSYQHTDAGIEATGLLAKYLLDGGDSEGAAQCFQRLFERVGIAKLPALTLFQAAYAFHQSADTENENRAWRELSTRAREVRLGNTVKSVEELKEYVRTRSRSATEANLSDWPVVGGRANRNGRGEGDTPCLEPRATIKTAQLPEVEAVFKKAAADMQLHGQQPVISACSPVAATITYKGERRSLVVYRSTWGVHALDTRTGKPLWYNNSTWGLDNIFQKSENRPIADWVNTIYLPHQPSMLFENSTIGTLSTNGSFVFAIDDLPVTPPPTANVNFQPNPPNMLPSGKGAEAMKANTLMAYDLASGKLKWILEAAAKTPDGTRDKDTLHPDTLFLGAPLPLSGRLYVLADKQQELQLLTLDALTGHVLQRQLLGRTRDKLTQDGPRRSKAAHLASGEGMLICPTNAGAIFGYDLLDKSLVWAYHYRDGSGPDAMPRMGPRGNPNPGPPWQLVGNSYYYLPKGSNNWKVTPPIVQDGKVIFTAYDSASVHCLNLHDGSPLWRVQRGEDDYYLAGVFNGKVLIVGKTTVKALDLATGKQVWATSEAGIPSGIGTASENLYYLPVKEAPGSKEPEIVAIDVDTGTIAGRARSRLREIPGNLIFFEGDVVSQTATDITIYPQMKTKLAQIDDSLRNNPNDPNGLTERGELRLDRGDLRGAVEDLTRALENKPPADVLPRTQSRLFDALTSYLLRDFDAAEKYLEKYEDLCKVDTRGSTPEQTALLEKESRRRKVNLLFLVGRGKEGQRKLVEAFQKYEEVGALPVGPDDLISPPDEPTVRGRPEVLARGRIAALLAGAKAEERRPLEELIAARWLEVKKNSNPDQLRRFVDQYGSLFEAGREARLFLANQLVEGADPSALLEAERQLTLLRNQSGGDRRLVARAIEALARLSTRKGLLEDAGYYYSLLGSEYSKEDLGDGRTGADVYNDVATDKRIRPYLDRRPGFGGSGPVHYEKAEGTRTPTQKIYHFEPVGERLPYFRSHEVTLRDRDVFVLADAQTGKDLWVKPLRPTQFSLIATQPLRPTRSGELPPASGPKAPVLTMGHLVVLPLGQWVFGIDPVHQKIIWEKDLQAPLPGQSVSGVAQGQLVVDDRDGSVQMLFADGWMQQVGIQTGPLQGDAVYLQSKEGLVALDPLTGALLWVRSDMPGRCHLFGDDQNLYVVEHNSTNKPSATRAVRASDGATVKVPDFTTAYKNRLKVLGRHLLVADAPEKGAPPAQTVLRLYDVPTGKDVWSVTYEAGTQVLEPETRDFVGVVDSKGKIHIHDATTGKEVVVAAVRDPLDIEGTWVGHLVSDRDQVYAVFCRPLDRSKVAINGINTNVMPGTGLRTLPVNGNVYAFLPKTGKLHWIALVENQMLVLEQFENLPMLLFTARYQQTVPGMAPGQPQTREVVKLWSVDKRTGKSLILVDALPDGRQFYALRVDTRAGKIEFLSENHTAVHSLNPPEQPLNSPDALKETR